MKNEENKSKLYPYEKLMGYLHQRVKFLYDILNEATGIYDDIHTIEKLEFALEELTFLLKVATDAENEWK